MGDPIARVHNNASGVARGIQGQHSLDGHVHGWRVESLEHNLNHLLTVDLGIQGGLCQQHRVLLRGHMQLVVESGVPDLLHVVPVGDDAVLDGVFQGQDATLALGLMAHIAVLLPYAHHDTLVLEAPYGGWEHGPGGIIPRKAIFAHAGDIVDDERCDLFFNGDLRGWWSKGWEKGSTELPDNKDSGLAAVSEKDFLFIFKCAPLLGTYIFTRVKSYCLIYSFNIMQCPSLSLVKAFVWKSILADKTIAIPAVFIWFHLHKISFSIHLLSVCILCHEVGLL